MKAIAAAALDRIFGRQRHIREQKAVLLTFDDGPDPDVTPGVLERLAAYGARAVFFVVGNRIPKAPHLLKRILDEGHVLGNHTFMHRLDRDPDPVTYYRDVQKCQRAVEELVGQQPQLFRAPMGRSSAGALLAPRLLKLKHVLWSIDSDDWQLRSAAAAAATAERLCANVSPGDIVLMHDDNPWVLAVLDTLLPNLCLRGIDLQQAASVI